MAEEQAQNLVTIYVDGVEVQVPEGVMLVEATLAVDVEIPVFCYHPKLEPVGMCRMCLVELGTPSRRRSGELELDEEGNPVIRWFPKLMTACTTPVTDGMHVRVATDRVADAWRGTLEFLLTSHPLDCPVCDKGGECPLQDLTFAYGPDLSRFYKRNKFHFEKPIPLGELIWLDRERCIYCARCVRFQDEIAGDPVLKFADRNRGQEIVTFSDPPFDSYFSGNTTDICPVGALTTEDFRFKARVWELDNVPSIDPYDSVGSNIVLGVRTDGIKRIMPRANEWVNEIWISDKCRFGHHFVRDEGRLTTPLVRGEDGELHPATWHDAIEVIADRLAGIAAIHGAGAIGGIGGDRTGNEDLYLFAKLMREVIGTPHLDFRLHWPTDSGIEEAIADVGLASGTNLGELGKGATLLLLGSDLEEEQPVLYLRARRAAQQGANLVVAGRYATKEMGDATRAMLLPEGGEAALAQGLVAAALDGREVDWGRVGGGDVVEDAAARLDRAELAAAAGLDADDLKSLADELAESEQLVILVGRAAAAAPGARAMIEALAALLVATGHAGKVGSGLAALWPHNNSQGAADMGVLPHLAAGYQPVESPGATVEQMLSGEAGLRAAYVIAADPARERPASRETLEGLEFLVVQELFLTETAQLADVVLPAAAFAERDGTFTNFERRVQRFLKGVEPPGEARADWEILAKVAAALGAEWPEYFTATDVADEIARTVRPYKGIDYQALRGEPVPWATTAAGHHIFTGTSTLNSWYGIQWPVAAEARRPKFSLAWSGAAAPSRSTAGEGMRLIGRRKLYDNGTMIARSELLDARRARARAVINPADAAALALGPDDGIALGEGGPVLPVEVGSGVPEGSVLLTMGVDPAVDALLASGPDAVQVSRATATPV